MSPAPASPPQARVRLRIPSRPLTVRLRLTAQYSVLFLLCGSLLITVICLWYEQWADRSVSVTMSGFVATSPSQVQHGGLSGSASASVRAPHGAGQVPPDVREAAAQVRDALLRQLLTISGVSLALLVLVSVVIGWYMAGRALRPVHGITATARRLSSENLHERIGLAGPRDEFRELADTFDALLDRLEAAFDSQQRFIANASHELRTPLAIQRAAIQIGLLGGGSPDRIAKASRQLLDANRRSELLIDGLLLLARSERGLTRREPVALEATAAEALAQYKAAAQDADITVDPDLQPVTVLGDRVLLLQLVTNLVQNAIRYNHSGGSLRIHTSPGQGLIVRNTGPRVPAEALPELFEPFRRGVTARTGTVEGAGLGLSIVRSITEAHAGTVTARTNDDGGGLEVRVTLPWLPDMPRRTTGAIPLARRNSLQATPAPKPPPAAASRAVPSTADGPGPAGTVRPTTTPAP